MLLEKNSFLVKEHVEILKLAGTYDILDPETSEQLAVAKEEPGGLVKLLKLFINKLLLPTKVSVYESDNLVFYIQKPFTFIQSKVSIYKSSGEYLGYFKSKVFTIGGGFYVFDASDRQIAEIKGNWAGWDFRFVGVDGREIGTVNKKWAGALKEIFTSADNYLISLNQDVPQTPESKMLLIAAGLAIDIIYKERR